MSDEERPEFSVYLFFPDGQWECVKSFVLPQEAAKCATALFTSVGAQIGTTRRVIITDGGDFAVFEWQFGKGITFPPELRSQK